MSGRPGRAARRGRPAWTPHSSGEASEELVTDPSEIARRVRSRPPAARGLIEFAGADPDEPLTKADAVVPVPEALEGAPAAGDPAVAEAHDPAAPGAGASDAREPPAEAAPGRDAGTSTGQAWLPGWMQDELRRRVRAVGSQLTGGSQELGQLQQDLEARGFGGLAMLVGRVTDRVATVGRSLVDADPAALAGQVGAQVRRVAEVDPRIVAAAGFLTGLAAARVVKARATRPPDE